MDGVKQYSDLNVSQSKHFVFSVDLLLKHPQMVYASGIIIHYYVQQTKIKVLVVQADLRIVLYQTVFPMFKNCNNSVTCCLHDI